VLLALVIPLCLSFAQPRWKIHLVSPEYSQGLDLQIDSHKIAGDIDRINTLSTSTGMAQIDPRERTELDWMPFALGALILRALRVVAVGDVRSLIDLAVLVAYFSVFSLGRFYYTLRVFGRSLDPYAMVKVEPFTPALYGSQQIADITTSSQPHAGAWLIGIFAVGVWIRMFWHLARGHRDPVAAARG